jgi:hypothetical protein
MAKVALGWTETVADDGAGAGEARLVRLHSRPDCPRIADTARLQRAQMSLSVAPCMLCTPDAPRVKVDPGRPGRQHTGPVPNQAAGEIDISRPRTGSTR